MLKNIRLHLEEDDERQAKLDEELARHITHTHGKNINAFQRNIPSVLDYVKDPKLQRYSLFANRNSDVNIVDFGTGRTVYGLHPRKEVCKQFTHQCEHSLSVAFDDSHTFQVDDNAEKSTLSLESLPTFIHQMSLPPMPKEVECLVVLGCGLGLHIRLLLEHYRIKHLVLYEPEPQFFQCSVLTTSWSEIFDLAKEKQTALFLQVEKDGRDIVQDMAELQQHAGIAGFHVYKHYNHPVFDQIVSNLRKRTWQQLQEQGLSYRLETNYKEFVPTWTDSPELRRYSSVDISDPFFEQNMQAFKKYIPNIYKEFENYSPSLWLPVKSNTGGINVLKKDDLLAWYSDAPEQDCYASYIGFTEHPNKDGLILGYNGTKLAHYQHYQFVKETEALLQEVEEEVGALPEKVPSIIMFGLGVGYQLQTLVDRNTVEKLFVCEPNRDFFYASLFAINWHDILQKIDDSQSRIYLNIGDDGTHLFRDLLNQFYSIGPYILNNTYFYQSYYNAALNTAVAQLREQLQIVISMGEYFDHAYHGIAHTKYALANGIPFLGKKPSASLSYANKEVPVFVVGNGPSLDYSIETIREMQKQAIIISCGTSLQTLYRNGITPDFHAEIEQNRTTFDWVTRLGNFDFLKSIDLISCNGIHPETCELFRHVFLAFKDGESSTVSALEVLGEDTFATLKYAFPTVSNFVLDLFLHMGFQQLYLFGIDLGFKDENHHHSTQSGYYDDAGEALYNYQEKNHTAIAVAGNFRNTVFTKHEFKVSRMVMEQVLSLQKVECYNTSDGALIHGTTPLSVDNILLSCSPVDKETCLNQIKTSAFVKACDSDYTSLFESRFQQQALQKEVKHIKGLLSIPPESSEQALALMDEQKRVLFNSYQSKKSLLFYLLYGTSNYASAFLVKCLTAYRDKQKGLEVFNQGLDIWRHWFSRLMQCYSRDPDQWDSSHSLRGYRSDFLRSHNLRGRPITVVTDSSHFIKAFNHFSHMYQLDTRTLSFERLADALPLTAKEHELLIVYNKYGGFDQVTNLLETLPPETPNCIVICDDYQPTLARYPQVTQALLPGDITQDENLPTQCSETRRGSWPILWYTLGLSGAIIIPKYRLQASGQFPHIKVPADVVSSYHAYEDESLVILSPHPIPNKKRMLSNGDRIKSTILVPDDIAHIHSVISPQEHQETVDGLLTRFPFLREPDQVFE